MRWDEMSYNKSVQRQKELVDYEYHDREESYGLSEDIYKDSTYGVEEVFDRYKYDQEWN